MDTYTRACSVKS